MQGTSRPTGFRSSKTIDWGRRSPRRGRATWVLPSRRAGHRVLTRKPFYGLALTGDGSFTMNPQILIDGVEHGACRCILVLDNRRMGAISGLQRAQYGVDHATSDRVEVDYLAWGRAIRGVATFDGGTSVESLLQALGQARRHEGLSLVHLRVYFGEDPLGGLGAFGRWNVGNWCEATQKLRHDIGL